MTQACALLASEGFDQVADVAAHDGHRNVIWCNFDYGWLADVQEYQRLGEKRLGKIQIWYQAELIDPHMAVLVSCGSWPQHPFRDIFIHQIGQISSSPAEYGRGHGGSVRVALAVLRAFSRPLTPWLYENHFVWFGHDGASPQYRAEIRDALPTRVRNLIGPAYISV